MPHRLAAPAVSEQAFDISGELASQEGHNGPNIDVDIAISAADNDGSSDDDETFIAAQQAASNRQTSQGKGRPSKNSGGFQSMGLTTTLLKAVSRKGFSVPTPIQRKAIPLILDKQDVVGMARTGSGKTAAFVIPMIEKFKTHSNKVGARAIVLSPSRELALQTLKAVKEFGRGTDLRAILLVGGDSLEEQFSQMSSNPDIIIATPGRFLHLMVEMSLDMSSVRYAVFDEADRLFEMGFAAQLTEILHALPPSRQTLLFSATLPSSLVEFARAGLREPKLVRLDAESKISADLQNAFLAVKSAEKEGALLHILQDVLEMPMSVSLKRANRAAREEMKGVKRKRDSELAASLDPPTAHSTIIFVATKHHVEYLCHLLRLSGFAVSFVYGSLDQTARKMQVENFRNGRTTIMVVTDVAARGIDIPLIANVINYDFPPQPKIFVHRVGRTARAGRSGWSYSILQTSDMPYLLDLQLFLGKKLVIGRNVSDSINFTEDMILGGIPRPKLEKYCELVTKMVDEADDLEGLRSVAVKGEKLYIKTRNSASMESARRAKALSEEALRESNMLYSTEIDAGQLDRDHMLARISGFRPTETVFESGSHGEAVNAAQSLRKLRVKRRSLKSHNEYNMDSPDDTSGDIQADLHSTSESKEVMATDDEIRLGSADELEVTFPEPVSRRDTTTKNLWEDSEHFMSYQPRNTNPVEDRAYGIQSGSYNTSKDFVDAARGVTMNLNNDESRAFAEASRPSQIRWDKKSKKYVSTANDRDGSKGVKMIRGESGQMIAASFRSGRFQAWKKTNRLDRLPKTGEMEMTSKPSRSIVSKKFKHYAERAPKQPDKYRDDFHKKKTRMDAIKSQSVDGSGFHKPKNELRGAADVQKERQLKQKRKEKNARPRRKRV